VLILETERLILVEWPLEVMERRLREDDFEADVPGPHGMLHLHFPPEWPGEALGLFEGMIKRRREDPLYEGLGGLIAERDSGEVVGGMSFRTDIDRPGTFELGYGINPSRWNRGYGTEMARAMVDWARQRPDVDRIISACLTDNTGSIRVLEKTGFRRTGERDDDEGRLIEWEYGGDQAD
jgi:RimJ/RimL family protein N-acetyltransferase